MHILNNTYHFINKFNKSELDNLNPKKISIIYRNYSDNYKIDEILNLKKYCKNRSFKLFLANNFKLAWKLNLNGTYIPAFNRSLKHKLYPKKNNFLVIGSSHNLPEINIKIKQGCKIVFLSPVFKVSKNKRHLGLFNFRNICNQTKSKIIALGGINEKNIKKLKITKSFGFASISYIKKTAQKTGPF